MRVLVVGEERDLSGVTARVVRDGATPDEIKRAEARLKAANPGVRFNRLKAGDVLFVPAGKEFASARSEDVLTAGVRSMAEQAREGLSQLQARIVAADKAVAGERDALGRHLKSRVVKVVTDRDESLRKDVDRLREVLAQADTEAPARLKALRKAVEQIQVNLTDLERLA